jgi:hypothetical protein
MPLFHYLVQLLLVLEFANFKIDQIELFESILVPKCENGLRLILLVRLVPLRWLVEIPLLHIISIEILLNALTFLDIPRF